MSVLLQISDTHFGTEQEPVVTALLELARRTRPELVVLSGDVTQRARRAQFAAARLFVDQLPAPVIAIPGNHDIPLFNVAARVLAPYANYTRAFGLDLEPQYASDAFLVLCANTTRPKRHKDGEISQAQIERIAERLRHAARDQLRIVVVHQPVLVIREEDRQNLLHGHERAVRAWSEAGADIVMGGHIHLPYLRPIADENLQLPRRMWAVQAGTALSRRIRGSVPNSVNILRHSPRDLACNVERWDFEAASNAFRCIRTESLQLDRGERAALSEPSR